MKRLFLIGGPMGVGKTAVGRALQALLPGSVFLDGDWCWDANPFAVTPETQAMVLENIQFLLGQFLRCSAYSSVIFCWVMHRQDVIDQILSGLELAGVEVCPVSLTADPQALRRRLEGDVAAGIRRADVVGRSLSYLPLYDDLDTIKLDTTKDTPRQTACRLLAVAEGGAGMKEPKDFP